MRLLWNPLLSRLLRFKPVELRAIAHLSSETQTAIFERATNSTQYQKFERRAGIWPFGIAIFIASSTFGIAKLAVEHGIVGALWFLGIVVALILMGFALGLVSTTLRRLAFTFLLVWNFSGIIGLILMLLKDRTQPWLIATVGAFVGGAIAYEIVYAICAFVFFRASARFLNTLAAQYARERVEDQ